MKTSPKRRNIVRVKIERLPHAHDLDLPEYQTAGAVGLDVLAAVPAGEPMVLKPRTWRLVPTGLRFELPAGFEAQVRPRSGLALRHGVTVLNAPGTIDEDYRGEVKVLLINHGAKPFAVARGERIAQLVVAAVVRADLSEVKQLAQSERGAGGFGSTGVTLRPKTARKKGAAVARLAKPAKGKFANRRKSGRMS